MRNPRVYQNQTLQIETTIELDADAFGHIIRVLRLTNNDNITLFNGQLFEGKWGEFNAELINVGKKSAQALIHSFTEKNTESPLNIHLGQGISRGDRMDFTLQKSVELGVNTITPLFTERCGVKLNAERLNKKREQWQKIVNSACEQSGRCNVPEVKQPEQLTDWLAQQSTALKLNLHPKAQHSIMSIPEINDRVRLLVGPEGGLTDEEITTAEQYNFQPVLLGPRVLRTETAALTAITALQCRYGDIK
ncbi:16S rRNA (uracil(1498)-N(3))-methyltransferase [Thalassotalea piscium]|uniref:Ribosomal RNA small subunit methyltransferase E n=1 Tax=Thalassotalea piscium TaxID=1230533 RepID=A0A7X0TUX2_9GAMM|nr:16S rRNA (uracil(1498)-N(3))-methyltransferase [Thalassotalea piscium]MBB6544530.1 16S rRNA (uracil1498-N3)-methyltransferase [Thalassotalea piscium]